MQLRSLFNQAMARHDEANEAQARFRHLLELAIAQRDEANEARAQLGRLLDLAIAQRNESNETQAVLHRLLDLGIAQRNQALDALGISRQECERAFARLTTLGRAFVDDIFGHRMYANPDDAGLSIAEVAPFKLETLGGEYGFLRRTIKRGQTVLDIGANVGLFTLLFARAVGSAGRVYAFEPGPLSFGLLKANIAINQYQHVIAENAAVLDCSGEVELFVSRSGESDNRVVGVAAEDNSRYKTIVRCLAIDDYLPRDTSIDFIKIDVQGAEFNVLKGMEKTIDSNHELQIVLEYAPGSFELSDVDPKAYFAFMRGHGFSIYELPNMGEEALVDEDWLLSEIGGSNKPQQTNLVLRRP